MKRRELTYDEMRALEAHAHAHHVPGDAIERAEFYLTRGMTDDVDEAVEWGKAWLRNTEEQAARKSEHTTGATRFVRDNYGPKPINRRELRPHGPDHTT